MQRNKTKRNLSFGIDEIYDCSTLCKGNELTYFNEVKWIVWKGAHQSMHGKNAVEMYVAKRGAVQFGHFHCFSELLSAIAWMFVFQFYVFSAKLLDPYVVRWRTVSNPTEKKRINKTITIHFDQFRRDNILIGSIRCVCSSISAIYFYLCYI